jgi:hypothetical protein
MRPHLEHAAPKELGSRFGGETINVKLLTELRVAEKSKRKVTTRPRNDTRCSRHSRYVLATEDRRLERHGHRPKNKICLLHKRVLAVAVRTDAVVVQIGLGQMHRKN